MVLEHDPNGQEQQQQHPLQEKPPASPVDPTAHPTGLAANLSAYTTTDGSHLSPLPRIRIGTDTRYQGADVENPSPHPPVTNLNNAHHFISIKLTPKTFLLWSNQLTFFLKSQGLIGFVDGSSPCPPPFSPHAAIWEQ
ncbi:hypothetical protein LIER_36730 [Lithospermum erythrorhizon]|uniref:Retrotransposon Copia-like N-terminal domain-containing protein n=1 Tax=Lithospermum erythrorhizon TaxID=34254 RepID=A0AAV3PA05_LITER